MDIAKSTFNFFHDQLGQRSTTKLCNGYGGTEMMDNICDTFASWNEVVSRDGGNDLQASGFRNSVFVFIQFFFISPVLLLVG